jgi:hypothetical protein
MNKIIIGAVAAAALAGGILLYGSREYDRGYRKHEMEVISAEFDATAALNKQIYELQKKLGVRNEKNIDADGAAWLDGVVPVSLRLCAAANNCFTEVPAAAGNKPDHE